MRINLKELETGPYTGESVKDFSFDLDMTDVIQWGTDPFILPIRVEGRVKSYLGIITCEYSARYTRKDKCARCLSPVSRQLETKLSHVIMERAESDAASEDSDGYIYAAEGILDMDELVRADILLEQEPLALCSEDCKGICQSCGANRNENTCSCGGRAVNSPFAALLDYMDEKP